MTVHVCQPTDVKFAGIDNHNRPIFRATTGDLKRFYGSTYVLFPAGATEAEVLSKVTANDLVYFGNHFGCEPHGLRATLTIVTEKKYIDIPNGYLYGFPRLYDKPEDMAMADWLISHGVPEKTAYNLGYIRFFGKGAE